MENESSENFTSLPLQTPFFRALALADHRKGRSEVKRQNCIMQIAHCLQSHGLSCRWWNSTKSAGTSRLPLLKATACVFIAQGAALVLALFMKKLFSKLKSSMWFSGSSQAMGSYRNVSSSDAERFACDSWLHQNCLVWHFAAWIKSLNTWQVVFGHSYVCCTTFSSLHWKCFPSLLWASVFLAPLCRLLFEEKR